MWIAVKKECIVYPSHGSIVWVLLPRAAVITQEWYFLLQKHKKQCSSCVVQVYKSLPWKTYTGSLFKKGMDKMMQLNISISSLVQSFSLNITFTQSPCTKITNVYSIILSNWEFIFSMMWLTSCKYFYICFYIVLKTKIFS